MKLRLSLGRQQALIIQDFETMAELLSRAFGGKKNNQQTDDRVPANKEQAMAAFAGVFGT